MKRRAYRWLSCLAIVSLAIAASRIANGQDGPIAEAEQLNAQLQQLFKERRYEEAIPLAQRALAIRENELGDEHPDTGISLNNLAELYSATGAWAKAEPLYLRAVAIHEKALGPENMVTAVSLYNLAALYEFTGRYTQAETLYQRALEIRQSVLGPEHSATSDVLNTLAHLYQTIGAYSKAEALYRRALQIREKVFGPEDPATAALLSNLSLLYQAMGAYSEAGALAERALAINEKASGPESLDTATVLNNLALLYQLTGAYRKAEPLYLRSLAIKENTLGPSHNATATSINNLALLYRATGAFGKAEPLLQRVLTIRESTLGSDHLYTAMALNNLAELYRSIGNYTQAEPLHLRALSIREKLLGREHQDTADSLENLALLYKATGAYAKARPLYLRAVEIYQNALGPKHPNTARSLADLAAFYEAADDYSQAEPLRERVQAIDENNTVRFLLSGSESRKQAYLQLGLAHAYANVSCSLVHATERSKALGFTSVLQFKGRVLDAMSDSAARLRRSVAPEDRALFIRLSNIAQELSILAFRGPGNLPATAHRERLDALANEQEHLEADLSRRSAALREAITPVSVDTVRRALPSDATLVEWFRYQPFNPKAPASVAWDAPHYAAYIMRPADPLVVLDLGSAEAIEDLVAEFRVALSDPTSTYFEAVAKELSEKLIAPMLPHLGSSQRLLLSPDGALNLVPFAALMDEHGEYLARSYELTYLTSGRDLLRMVATSPTRGGSSVLLANPDYGQGASKTLLAAGLRAARSGDLDRSGMMFAQLPGTTDEANALQSLLRLQRRNVLTGDRATEATLKKVHGPRILHVATHGFFLNDRQIAALNAVEPESDTFAMLGENPLLRSGLALAGANARRSGATDDGILTAAEVAQLDLHGTHLVVLSACETGVGTILTGEGVYGLRRALVLAGAQAQVASLWKVSDAATRDLMVDYYTRLLKGEGRSAALRNSQRTMMLNPARQHPYYWAAFIPIGDWTALSSERH